MSSKNCENVDNVRNHSGFELIIVLFILLIIVGAAFVGTGFDGAAGHDSGCY